MGHQIHLTLRKHENIMVEARRERRLLDRIGHRAQRIDSVGELKRNSRERFNRASTAQRRYAERKKACRRRRVFDERMLSLIKVYMTVAEILDQKRTRRTMRMYSAEQRKKAVETFARFGCSAADTIAEVGYPNRHMLRSWWKEYQIGGDDFLERRHRRPKYSDEEKQSVADHYLDWSTGKASPGR